MMADIENPAAQEICPVCDSADVSVFWEMSGLPIHCNVLCAMQDEALNVPRGDIRLALCACCGFIYNITFDPQRMYYGQSYENPLEYSPRFQEYARSLASRLIDRYGLSGKTILEIACGKGNFLTLLCRLGDNHGIGFDPGCPQLVSDNKTQPQLTFIQDFYSDRYAHYKADLICCRHALEHIPDPVAFLRMIRHNIGDRRDTAVFFEVPNVLYTVRDLGIWDIIYEHCSYFSPEALVRCFIRAGFAVSSVAETYDTQFLCIEAIPNGIVDTRKAGDTSGAEVVAHGACAFADRCRQKLESWMGRLDRLRQSHQRVVIWGAGSKGVTFLNMMRCGDSVECVVDINPRKQGMYIAGTAHPIVAPDYLRDDKHTTIIVMNPIYEDEIHKTIESLDVSADLLVA